MTRVRVGTDASISKGLVERHLQLPKLIMSRLGTDVNKQAIELKYSEVCMEAWIAQNHMLEYAGDTPRMELAAVSVEVLPSITRLLIPLLVRFSLVHT